MSFSEVHVASVRDLCDDHCSINTENYLKLYLQIVKTVQQSFSGASSFLQEPLCADHIQNLTQQQGLGGVAHPRVEDAVCL